MPKYLIKNNAFVRERFNSRLLRRCCCHPSYRNGPILDIRCTAMLGQQIYFERAVGERGENVGGGKRDGCVSGALCREGARKEGRGGQSVGYSTRRGQVGPRWSAGAVPCRWSRRRKGPPPRISVCRRSGRQEGPPRSASPARIGRRLTAGRDDGTWWPWGGTLPRVVGRSIGIQRSAHR